MRWISWGILVNIILIRISAIVDIRPISKFSSDANNYITIYCHMITFPIPRVHEIKVHINFNLIMAGNVYEVLLHIAIFTKKVPTSKNLTRKTWMLIASLNQSGTEGRICEYPILLSRLAPLIPSEISPPYFRLAPLPPSEINKICWGRGIYVPNRPCPIWLWPTFRGTTIAWIIRWWKEISICESFII